jgi:hypothetical protein
MLMLAWFVKRGIAGGREGGVAGEGRGRESLPNKALGLRLEFVAEVRRAVGRGQCSSQKGSGAEAECIECVFRIMI